MTHYPGVFYTLFYPTPTPPLPILQLCSICYFWPMKSCLPPPSTPPKGLKKQWLTQSLDSKLWPWVPPNSHPWGLFGKRRLVSRLLSRWVLCLSSRGYGRPSLRPVHLRFGFRCCGWPWEKQKLDETFPCATVAMHEPFHLPEIPLHPDRRLVHLRFSIPAVLCKYFWKGWYPRSQLYELR